MPASRCTSRCFRLSRLPTTRAAARVRVWPAGRSSSREADRTSGSRSMPAASCIFTARATASFARLSERRVFDPRFVLRWIAKLEALTFSEREAFSRAEVLRRPLTLSSCLTTFTFTVTDDATAGGSALITAADDGVDHGRPRQRCAHGRGSECFYHGQQTYQTNATNPAQRDRPEPTRPTRLTRPTRPNKGTDPTYPTYQAHQASIFVRPRLEQDLLMAR